MLSKTLCIPCVDNLISTSIFLFQASTPAALNIFNLQVCRGCLRRCCHCHCHCHCHQHHHRNPTITHAQTMTQTIERNRRILGGFSVFLLQNSSKSLCGCILVKMNMNQRRGKHGVGVVRKYFSSHFLTFFSFFLEKT